MYIVPKTLMVDSSSSKESKMVEKLREEMKEREINWEY